MKQIQHSNGLKEIQLFNPHYSRLSYYKTKLPAIYSNAQKLFHSKMGNHYCIKNLLRLLSIHALTFGLQKLRFFLFWLFITKTHE